MDSTSSRTIFPTRYLDHLVCSALVWSGLMIRSGPVWRPGPYIRLEQAQAFDALGTGGICRAGIQQEQARLSGSTGWEEGTTHGLPWEPK